MVLPTRINSGTLVDPWLARESRQAARTRSSSSLNDLTSDRMFAVVACFASCFAAKTRTTAGKLLIPSRIRKINVSSLNQFDRWLNGPTRFTDAVELLVCPVVPEALSHLLWEDRSHLAVLTAKQIPAEASEFLRRVIVGPGSYGTRIVLRKLLPFEGRCSGFPAVSTVNPDPPIKALVSRVSTQKPRSWDP